ncbi:MAG: response regulator transcription factor [Chloroflexota bacterium]|nr:response regulator transcription factor [Chloroflexota bacterium]
MNAGRALIGEGRVSVNDGRHVLVVDDDATIVALMRDFLEAEGFQVEGAMNADEARTILERLPVDCVLLDVMMPGESGFELVRSVRQTSDVPILFLSARGEDVDKLRGLGLGGDDYIVKSATPAEVVARVKAVLRRSGRGEPAQDALMDFGRLVLDVRAREVRVDGALVPFTPREYELLCHLAEHPRQVFTYEQLLERFWRDVGDRHTVTVHMRRIREKIEVDPSNPLLVRNVWGVGYRFEGKRR